MSYQKINNLLGWLTFLIASLTYILTLEPSGSYWDCGEFISAAYKLQVVHQPGAPLFLMIGKLFSLLSAGDVTKVAYWVNISSALSSGATILFLFWTITALAKKILVKRDEVVNTATLIQIMGAGLVGALAYAFSDTFWFSAVEAEVYAMSSLATAIVFWAILKWDAHADEPYADRWLIFIAYIMGLSIGIHLLNLLVIPAIALVYYFRRTAKATNKGVLTALLVGIFILGIIQYGIIQYLVKFAAYFDLFFVNTLGLGFGSGVIFFLLLLVAGLVYGINYSIKKHKVILNLALICTVFILLGYSSFAMIIIRAKANTTLNNSDPENVFSFLGYLNREQYGDRPLLYGQYFDSKPIDQKEGSNIYRKGENKYEIIGKKPEYVYDRNTLLPRMYSDDAQHVGFYRDWMGMSAEEQPTFTQNLGFLGSYQIGFMYMRYFLWNFVGRQNDDQGNGDYTRGNFITGIPFIDNLRLGDQSNLPPSIKENKGHNKLYMLPLILGIIGAFWHFKRQQKDAGIVALLFFFTGLAIVLYLNQNPLQPRERDYAYAGSFYAFTIWIGLAVPAIASWLKKINPQTAGIAATVIGLLACPVLMASQNWDDHDRSEKTTARDLAKNYLNSCAPNAILFTYGDNDTYPLWYVQEVENFRPDVRIVNLSLFDTDWNINQLRLPFNSSQPLPMSLKKEQYVSGVRDILFYQDYNLEGFQEVKDVMEFITSDNPDAKVQYTSGKMENFLPTKNLKLTINPDEVIATKTISTAERNKIVPAMEWKLNGNYLTKGQLAMLDILQTNRWKRPIYFSFTVPNSQFLGLDNYLFNEGFAMRLVPATRTQFPETALGRTDDVNTTEMYNNMMNKFVWGNMKNANYLDIESAKMAMLSLNKFTELAKNLMMEGKKEQARKALVKAFEVLPIYTTFDTNFALSKYEMIELLYQTGMKKEASNLLKQTADVLVKELNYQSDVTKTKENVGANDIRLSLFVYNELGRISSEYKDPMAGSIQMQIKNYEATFGQMR